MTQQKSHGYKVVEDVVQGMGANGLMPDGSISFSYLRIISLNNKIKKKSYWD